MERFRKPLRRNRFSRDPIARVLIVTEGVKTEPPYFRCFAREAENQLVKTEIVEGGGDPKYLVEQAVGIKKANARQAKAERDDNVLFDEIWCVFDVDDHLRLPDAIQQARHHDIQLAVSNPCFELWALLHVGEQNAYIERRNVVSAFKKHHPRYKKTLPFYEIHPNYASAVRRAANLDKRHSDQGQPGENPSTGVYKLTEQIKKLGRKARNRSG